MAGRDDFEQTAKGTPFNNNGTILVSKNTEDAIKEILNVIGDASRALIFSQYNGNANTGRYLEFWSGISSNDAPISVQDGFDVVGIVARTTATNATCTIGFYDQSASSPGTLLYTVTFTAQKEVDIFIDPIFSIPNGADLSIKVDSGSISKPHLYLVVRGA